MHSFHQQCKECDKHCAGKLTCSDLSNEQICTIKAMDNMGFTNGCTVELPQQAPLIGAWLKMSTAAINVVFTDTADTYQQCVSAALQKAFNIDLTGALDSGALTGQQTADLTVICKALIASLATVTNASKVIAALTKVQLGRSDVIHELKCTINTLSSVDTKDTIAQLMHISTTIALMAARPAEIVGDQTIALAVTLKRLGAIGDVTIMVSPLDQNCPLMLLNAVVPVMVNNTVATGEYAIKCGQVTTYHPGLYEMLEYVLGDMDKGLCQIGSDIKHFIDHWSATSALCQLLLDKVLRTKPKTPLQDSVKEAILRDVEEVAVRYGKTKEFEVFASNLS